MDETRYFRRGLGNRDQVLDILRADYHSGLVEFLKANGYRFRHGSTEVHLAREFGFCYGVDRAVEFAYEARSRFPERVIWITGEIIHNPGVNRRLLEMGIRFLPPQRARNSVAGSAPGAPSQDGPQHAPQDSAPKDRLAEIGSEDVVLIPAFGMDHEEFRRLQERGSILVDTTCGSVLTVWKSVEKYARAGFTAIVHGKVDHEETRATCSQVRKHPGAHYLVVRDKEEAEIVCRFLRGELPGQELSSRLAGAYSEGFDPERDLQRIGLANQTTMLSSESLEIAGLLRDALIQRHGTEGLPGRFNSFDTICSATEERQEAVLELLQQGCDLIIVVGGFNSSNTTHLVEIASRTTPTYHVEDADNLISSVWIRHKPLSESGPIVQEGWLPPAGAAEPLSQEGRASLVIGLTAGASTPDSEIGRSIARLFSFRGVSPETVEALAREGMQIAEAKRRARNEAKQARP